MLSNVNAGHNVCKKEGHRSRQWCYICCQNTCKNCWEMRYTQLIPERVKISEADRVLLERTLDGPIGTKARCKVP